LRAVFGRFERVAHPNGIHFVSALAQTRPLFVKNSRTSRAAETAAARFALKDECVGEEGGGERESLVASFARGFGTEGEQEEHLLLLESGAGGKVPAHGIATSSPKWIGSTGVIAHPPKSQKKMPSPSS